MFKFVEDNVKGVGTKRKQSDRPCDACKRRHKRCAHNDRPRRLSPLASSPDSPSDTTRPRLYSETSPGSHISGGTISQRATVPRGPQAMTGSQQSPGSEDANIRFVAELCPESAFIINAKRPAGDGNISRHGVGLWFDQKADDDQATEPGPEEGDQDTANVLAEALDGGPVGQSLLLASLRPALRRECIATLPPAYELGLLSDLFYAKINPIFPLLEDEPWEKHSIMETTALKQCICLVASLDPTMRPHLRLPHTEHVLPQLDFRRRIAAAVKQSLDLGFIADEVVLLQVCTLMAMYVEKQGFGELSVHYCAQAVLHEQTLGFHVGWPDGRAGRERSRRLLWCVWVVDRLNAATNGRPTLIHRRDMDRKVMISVEDQPPPFKLLIRIAEFLDSTISLYRPHAMAQEQSDNANATFEDLVEASGAQNLSNGLLASLELFYLAVVILRGRPAGQRPSSELQWFCAARIVAIASGEYKSSLVFWPILPYSVTVAASVAYRSLRNSPMPYNRRRAYKLFQDSCELLEDLSKAFLSARAMARLAMDTMQEVERVAAERTRRDSIRPPEDTVPTTTGENVAENNNNPPYPPSHNVDPSRRPSLQVHHQLSQQQLDALPPLDPDFFNGFDGEAEIFGDFDPSFDLGRIDAIFSANLDPSKWPGAGQFTWYDSG